MRAARAEVVMRGRAICSSISASVQDLGLFSPGLLAMEGPRGRLTGGE